MTKQPSAKENNALLPFSWKYGWRTVNGGAGSQPRLLRLVVFVDSAGRLFSVRTNSAINLPAPAVVSSFDRYHLRRLGGL